MGRYGLAALRSLRGLGRHWESDCGNGQGCYVDDPEDAQPAPSVAPAPSYAPSYAPSPTMTPDSTDASMVTSPIQASASPGGSGVASSNDPAQNSGVNLVDFGATWCGWCVKMKPVVAQVEGVFPGHVFSVDVDQQPDLAQKYGINAYPAFVVFSDGAEVSRVTGATSKSNLVSMMNAAGAASGGNATPYEAPPTPTGKPNPPTTSYDNSNQYGAFSAPAPAPTSVQTVAATVNVTADPNSWGYVLQHGNPTWQAVLLDGSHAFRNKRTNSFRTGDSISGLSGMNMSGLGLAGVRGLLGVVTLPVQSYTTHQSGGGGSGSTVKTVALVGAGVLGLGILGWLAYRAWK